MKSLVDASMYSDDVLARFQAPPRAGWLESPSRIGHAASAVRDSEVHFALQLDGERIAAVRFRARGCPHTIAAASLVAERLEGGSAVALADFDAGFLVDSLPLPAGKLDLKLLLEDAVRAAATGDEPGNWNELGE